MAMGTAISTKCFHALSKGFIPNEMRDYIVLRRLIDGESCPREGVNGMPRKPDERMLCRLDFDPNDVKLIKNSEVSGFRVLI